MYPSLQFMTLDWMDCKTQNMESHEKLCCLALDEVQISKCIQYDSGLKQFVSFVSEEFKGIDFVLVGNRNRLCSGDTEIDFVL